MAEPTNTACSARPVAGFANPLRWMSRLILACALAGLGGCTMWLSHFFGFPAYKDRWVKDV